MEILLRMVLAVLVSAAPLPTVDTAWAGAGKLEPPSTNDADSVSLQLRDITVGTSFEDQKQEEEEKAGEAAKLQVQTRQNAPQRVFIVQTVDTSSVRDLGRQMVDAKWGDGQWESFDWIVEEESGWNVNAVNRSSGACGLPQAEPCSKLGDRSPAGQIQWMIDYIAGRYGTPEAARAWHIEKGWY